MRKCCRCECEMVENFNITAFSSIEISKGTGNGIFSKTVGKPKVAICPKCGEISLYIENLDKIKDK